MYIRFIESIQKYDITKLLRLSYKSNIKNAISKYAYNSIIPHNVIGNIKLVLDTMNIVVKQKAIRDKEELYRAVANEINIPVKRVQELYNVYTGNTKTQPLEIYSYTEEQEEIQQVYQKMHGDYTNETEARIAGDNLRQDIAKALRKLRHPSRSKKLEDYLDGNIIIDN